MKQPKPLIQQILDIFRVVLGGLLIVVAFSFVYTNLALFFMSWDGVYASPEEGMRAMIAKNYIASEDSPVIYSGNSSYDGSSTHIAYVVACIWGRRLDGTPTGSGGRHVYDQPGHFYLDTKKGWVLMPEGFGPTYIGYWMDVFGMAGPGLSEPSIKWGADKNCELIGSNS